jgi:hypothetical protein
MIKVMELELELEPELEPLELLELQRHIKK